MYSVLLTNDRSCPFARQKSEGITGFCTVIFYTPNSCRSLSSIPSLCCNFSTASHTQTFRLWNICGSEVSSQPVVPVSLCLSVLYLSVPFRITKPSVRIELTTICCSDFFTFCVYTEQALYQLSYESNSG